jgi:hypothetical protein
MLVFDPKVWGGKDRWDNSHCWKLATIIRRYRPVGESEELADVRFEHDGRVSRGHFVRGMRPSRGGGE